MASLPGAAGYPGAADQHPGVWKAQMEAAAFRLEVANKRSEALQAEVAGLRAALAQQKVDECTNGLAKLQDSSALAGGDSGSARDVLWELACGNKRWLRQAPSVDRANLVDFLANDPLNPASVKAIAVAEARSTVAPLDELFDLSPGSVQVVRVCGFTACGHSCGVVGSLEYALSDVRPKVLLVTGTSKNEAISSAVRLAMKAEGRTDFPAPPEQLTYIEEELDLMGFLLPAARDALSQMPHASFDRICLQAIKLNIWNTIESILTHSRFISGLVRSGAIELHGVFLESATGAAEFLGQHPSLQSLLKDIPSEDIIRTAQDPATPGEQALAELYAGNRRYAKGKGGKMLIHDERLLKQLTESGQNPVAIVLGCADSRAPVEILFDMRPGDLFVLRTAGNTVSSSKGTIIGSAEYAVGNLNTKLLVVAGHTKCGAVTATVDAARTNKPHEGFPGSIGHVLADMMEVAQDTIQQQPDEAIAQQVTRATQMNVFSTIEKIVRNSDMIKDAIKAGDLHVHGAVIDIFSGSVEWLGCHPKIEEIVEAKLPMHEWTVSPYQRAPVRPERTELASAAIARLKEGNRRFFTSTPNSPGVQSSCSGTDPYAIVVAGATLRVPIENIFDAKPGELLVQRVIGSLGGRQGGSIFASLEYAAARYAPGAVLFMGSHGSEYIKHALKHVQGGDEDAAASKRYVLDRLMVSALRAHTQVSSDSSLTAAGRDVKLQSLAEELNLLYSIEQVLRSPVIRSMVESGQTEIHAALLNEATGEVEFIGEHPMVRELVDIRKLSECMSPTNTSRKLSRQLTPTEPTLHPHTD